MNFASRAAFSLSERPVVSVDLIHADSAGVRYSPVFTGYYGAIYVGARRIVNTAAITVDVLPAAATQNPMSRSVSGLRTAG